MGGGGGATREARRARQAEEARRQRIQAGTNNVRGQFSSMFNSGYYKKMEDDILAMYNAELAPQWDDAQMQLQAALMRAGLNNSSIAVKRGDRLQQNKELAEQEIKERATGAVQTRKQQVADAEAMVLSQLNQSADADSAAAQAANRIQANYSMPQTPPLGMVFQDVAAGLATQADLERNQQNRYNMGVSQWGNNLARYMRNIGGG
jgi:hypothetical protein